MPIEVITPQYYGVKNLKVLLWLYNQQSELNFLNQFCNMLYIKKILIISLFLKDITKGADLTLVFMDELNEETMAMNYYYKMADKKTTILIKRDTLFATENIAHEIGHVLGAGHGPDISKLKLRLLECNVRLTLIPYSDALV